MSANLLDGKMLAATLRKALQKKITEIRKHKAHAPCLAVILAGTNPASMIYVANKHKACNSVGIEVKTLRFAETVSTEILLAEIARLNADDTVDGILVQLPLPPQVDPQKIIVAIKPTKDVDGFHPQNVGLLTLKMPVLRPATPKGIMMLLKHYVGEVKGKDALVIGASNIVGRPMALELLNHRATVTICHSQTSNLAEKVGDADLVIAAVGIPHFVKKSWIKPGAIVVDVGINRLPNGKLAGDVDFEEVEKVASWVSPVPGGVGPMTIAALLDNIVMAYEK